MTQGVIGSVEPLQLLIFGLAVFRLSLLLSKEDGPAWIFRKLRRSVPAKSSAKEGIQCLWCVSVWMAIPVSIYMTCRLLHVELPETLILLGDWFILMLALSAVAIIVNQQWTKN
jgi:hypothetical protein